MEQLKREYAVRTSETLRAVKTAMAFAPRDLWKCDPAVHKSGENYHKLSIIVLFQFHFKTIPSKFLNFHQILQ